MERTAEQGLRLCVCVSSFCSDGQDLVRGSQETKNCFMCEIAFVLLEVDTVCMGLSINI